MSAARSKAMQTKLSLAPFPYFGGKRTVADMVWQRLGRPKQYIEPFCGSAAMLLLAPERASLEVIGDQNFYVANFWRCIKFQPEETWRWQDYPVVHADIDARHRWLTQASRVHDLRTKLADAEWPGDPQIAGWWVWGQCCWIGSGWCEKIANDSQIPHVSDAGRGVQSQIPHVSDAGMGLLAGVTQDGVLEWFRGLSDRLARVRVINGAWNRTLNHHYGGDNTAVFLDPPYKAYEKLYSKDCARPVAADVEEWARANPNLRVALCGHVGDYDLPGWEVMGWSRGKLTYGGGKTTAQEAIWFSPACEPDEGPSAA